MSLLRYVARPHIARVSHFCAPFAFSPNIPPFTVSTPLTLSNPKLTPSGAQHLAFSPEFTAAVEAKQVAQQEAQRAAFVVDKARQEKQATIVRAQGEAKSAQLIGDAIKKSRSYVDLRKIENARSIATILQENGGKNRLYLDANGLGLNVMDTTTEKKE